MHATLQSLDTGLICWKCWSQHIFDIKIQMCWVSWLRSLWRLQELKCSLLSQSSKKEADKTFTTWENKLEDNLRCLWRTSNHWQQVLYTVKRILSPDDVTRNKCLECLDYDLCDSCRSAGFHAHHTFTSVHTHITCDQCGALPIRGDRWKKIHFIIFGCDSSPRSPNVSMCFRLSHLLQLY